MNIVGGVCSAILTALSAFVDAAFSLIEATTKIMDDYRKTVSNIVDEAQIRVPDPIPVAAGDSDGWDVQRQ